MYIILTSIPFFGRSVLGGKKIHTHDPVPFLLQKLHLIIHQKGTHKLLNHIVTPIKTTSNKQTKNASQTKTKTKYTDYNAMWSLEQSDLFCGLDAFLCQSRQHGLVDVQGQGYHHSFALDFTCHRKHAISHVYVTSVLHLNNKHTFPKFHLPKNRRLLHKSLTSSI